MLRLEEELAQEFQPIAELERIERKRLEEAWCREHARAENYRDIAQALSAFSLEQFKSLRESEERFQTFCDSVPFGIFLTDDHGWCSYANQAFLAITGLMPQESLGFGWTKILHPDDQQAVIEEQRQTAREGREFWREFRLMTPAEGIQWVRIHMTTLVSEGSRQTGRVGTVEDITECKRWVDALSESEEELQRIFDTLTDGITVTDLNGVITDLNQSALRLGGYTSKSELIGKSAFESIASHDRDRALARMMGLAQEGIVSSGEFTLLRTDGSTYPAEISANVLKDGCGNLAGFVSVIRDITERKGAEAQLEARAKELQASEEKCRRLLGDINDGYFVIQDEKIVIVNEKGAEVIGLSVEDILGIPLDCGARSGCRALQFILERYRKRISDGLKDERYEVTTETGRTFEISAKRIDYEGRPAVSAVVRDITERKQMEEALRNSALETLEALSQVIEANDPYTAGHSVRVTELALQIAIDMGVPEDQFDILRIAGPLHDVGKVGIPGTVLNKPSKLTQAEWLMIEAHPVVSAHTAEQVAAFKDAVPAIRHHHERWDGTGYPEGLKGEEIPLLARILAVADGFEAMTSDRPYRRARIEAEALEELRKGAGTQWDPAVVTAFLRTFRPKQSTTKA